MEEPEEGGTEKVKLGGGKGGAGEVKGKEKSV